jgi:hypothetical protein
MRYVLVLLVAVTTAGGAAASVTISLAPAYAGDSAMAIERHADRTLIERRAG